jgi:hypothetical protein
MRKVGAVEDDKEETRSAADEIAFGILVALLVSSPALFYLMIRVKAYLHEKEDQYVEAHKDDPKVLTGGRSCCNLLRHCRCRHCPKGRHLPVEEQPLYESQSGFSGFSGFSCPCRKSSENPRVVVEDLSASQPQDIVHDPVTPIDNGPTPLSSDLDDKYPSAAMTKQDPQEAKEPSGKRCCRCSCSLPRCSLRCCSLPRCCCCRRKEKVVDAGGGGQAETPVRIEPLQVDSDQVSPLQPALSPRETSKGAVAMAPDADPNDEGIRDPRGEVEPEDNEKGAESNEIVAEDNEKGPEDDKKVKEEQPLLTS